MRRNSKIYRNNEHYTDLTFGAAYANIKKEIARNNDELFMPWVYIVSPLRGDMKRNIENAKRYSRFSVKKNTVPMCPHIYVTQFLNDDNGMECRIGLILGLSMLKRCKGIWVFDDIVSESMANEIRIAEKRNIPVRYFTDKCEEAI